MNNKWFVTVGLVSTVAQYARKGKCTELEINKIN